MFVYLVFPVYATEWDVSGNVANGAVERWLCERLFYYDELRQD